MLVNQIPTDVLVIGGGSAGVAAAVSAAQKNVKVILLERNAYCGGKATAANVGTVCGLYLRSTAQQEQFACKGWVKKIADALAHRSATTVLHNSEGLYYLPYHPFAFKSLCDEVLHEAKVEVFYHTSITSCESSNNKINSVEALAFDAKIKFTPKVVIDCSGEAIVSHLAGLIVDESEEYQAAAQVFAVHNVSANNESSLSLSFLRELKKGIESGTLSTEFLRSSIVPGSLIGNQLFLKIALPNKISPLINSNSEVERVARKMTLQLFTFLKENVEAFKTATLGEIAAEAGIRTGRRPIGKYTLTKEDVLSCCKFENGIANGAWPIEFWEPGKKVILTSFSELDYYQIPATALESNQLENLFFAGRNISADNAAIASARVIGTCLQSGYAAGKLAAAKILGINAAQIIKEIREEQTEIF